VHPDCAALGSIPQHVASVAHVPVAPPLLLVLPELVLLDPDPPLLEVTVHSLWQFDVTHMPMFVFAVEQADSISLLTHDELDAALAEYVPPGHAHET
jgi:hypothetical protein